MDIEITMFFVTLFGEVSMVEILFADRQADRLRLGSSCSQPSQSLWPTLILRKCVLRTHVSACIRIPITLVEWRKLSLGEGTCPAAESSR